jgi:hypothetical protein
MERKHTGMTSVQSAFETISTAAVPHERKGKHNTLVSQIISDLLIVKPGNALKIPLLDLRKQKMENVRAAINRAGKKRSLRIATSSDDYFFYVWIANKVDDKG